jgi:hypothetical protein
VTILLLWLVPSIVLVAALAMRRAERDLAQVAEDERS